MERWRSELPEPPSSRRERWQERWGLARETAESLTTSREAADSFEKAAGRTKYPKQLAVLLAADPARLETGRIPVSCDHLAALADLLGSGAVGNAAAKELLERLWQEDADPVELAKRLGLGKITDRAALEELAREVIGGCARMAQDYRAGKTAALQALIGQMMRRTQGRADPELSREILLGLLETT